MPYHLGICKYLFIITILTCGLAVSESPVNEIREPRRRLVNFKQLRKSFRKSGQIIYSPVRRAARIVRKPFRDFNFWARAFHIYGSYKLTQARTSLVNRYRYRGVKFIEQDKNKFAEGLWDRIHEINSNRMMNLCLGLRGFYLKTGQFLGTRHDFMPQQFTVATLVKHIRNLFILYLISPDQTSQVTR